MATIHRAQQQTRQPTIREQESTGDETYTKRNEERTKSKKERTILVLLEIVDINLAT